MFRRVVLSHVKTHGASADMPVMPLRVPAAALAYSPLGSRACEIPRTRRTREHAQYY